MHTVSSPGELLEGSRELLFLCRCQEGELIERGSYSRNTVCSFLSSLSKAKLEKCICDDFNHWRFLSVFSLLTLQSLMTMCMVAWHFFFDRGQQKLSELVNVPCLEQLLDEGNATRIWARLKWIRSEPSHNPAQSYCKQSCVQACETAKCTKRSA